MRIGEFGVAKREADPDREPDTFGFCGQEFTISDDGSALPVLEWIEATADDLKISDPRALEITLRLIRGTIAPGDWQRFKRVAETNKAQVSDLLGIVYGIWEARSGRPTVRSSDSSDGPSDTGESSTAPSSSAASSDPTPIASGAVSKAHKKAMSQMRKQGLRSVDDLIAAHAG